MRAQRRAARTAAAVVVLLTAVLAVGGASAGASEPAPTATTTSTEEPAVPAAVGPGGSGTTTTSPAASATPTGTTAAPATSEASAPPLPAPTVPPVSPRPQPDPSPSAAPARAPAGVVMAAAQVLGPVAIAKDPSGTNSVSTLARLAWSGCPVGTYQVDAVATVAGDRDWGAGRLLFSLLTFDETATFGQFVLTDAGPAVVGRYDVVLTCLADTGEVGVFTGAFWVVEGGTWLATDPAATTLDTSVTFTLQPQDRLDLPGGLTLTATVRPGNAAGTVQFREKERPNGRPNFDTTAGYLTVGRPVPVRAGQAALKVSDLAFGMHVLSAVFTPAEPARFRPSVSAFSVFVAARPVPPVPLAPATVSGGATVGGTLTCRGSFRGAKVLTYQWLRDRAPIASASASTYRLTAADRGRPVTCRVSGLDGYGGSTRRTSAAVTVR